MNEYMFDLRKLFLFKSYSKLWIILCESFEGLFEIPDRVHDTSIVSRVVGTPM